MPLPNPKNFRIEKACSNGNYVMVMVHYPDCKNYEGRKILLFESVTLEQIVNLDFIDPHFCDGSHISPVARFVPTDAGWKKGLKLMGKE